MTKELTREQIINELASRGYDATASDVIKNGVVLSGITIRNETNIAPTIYIDQMIEHFDNIDDIVENIINIYSSNKSIDIDIAQLTDPVWILKHLYIALQKASDEPLIKKTCDFDGIEQYLYIRGNLSPNDGWSVKLNAGIMETANITLDDAWNAAARNTFSSNETLIQSMASLMSEMMGFPENDEFDEQVPPIYVITNQSKTKGSSAVLDVESIKNYFASLEREYHKFVVIPSSIHEVLLVPVDDETYDIDTFNAMVQEVNQQVDATEQLGSYCYILSI